MLKFAPYVLKSLLRHRSRTLLTVSGSAVALFVFAFIGAARQGLVDMTRGQQAERTLVVFQANRFCPSTSRLPEDYTNAIRKVPGVKDAVPIQVYVNNCRASLDLVLFHGLPPDKLRSLRDLKMLAGDRDAFDRQTDAALVGSALARRRNLSPGQKFTIGEITVSVVGVFAAATHQGAVVSTGGRSVRADPTLLAHCSRRGATGLPASVPEEATTVGSAVCRCQAARSAAVGSGGLSSRSARNALSRALSSIP